MRSDLLCPLELCRSSYHFSINAKRLSQPFPRTDNSIRLDVFQPTRIHAPWVRASQGVDIGDEPALGFFYGQPEQNPRFNG